MMISRRNFLAVAGAAAAAAALTACATVLSMEHISEDITKNIVHIFTNKIHINRKLCSYRICLFFCVFAIAQRIYKFNILAFAKFFDTLTHINFRHAFFFIREQFNIVKHNL